MPYLFLIGFSRRFFINPSVRTSHFLRKPIFIALSGLVVVGLKTGAWKYCESSDLVVWSRILFTTIFDCCVSRETSHVTVCLFLVPFIICCTFLWTDVSCWSWLIHHHMRPPMILVGSFSFWGKCEFVWLVCLCLVDVLLLHGTIPLCFHMVAFL